jgi:hypothetical protein
VGWRYWVCFSPSFRDGKAAHFVKKMGRKKRMERCEECGKTFKSLDSLRALHQHQAAKHHLQSAAKHHLQSAAHRRFDPDTYQGVPFPGANGRWVYREDYRGKKGFGIFVCDSCHRHWISAHAYSNQFGQDCQACEINTFPYIMWQSPTRDRDELIRDDEDDGPPHDSSRCDACKAGHYCTKPRGSYSSSYSLR